MNISKSRINLLETCPKQFECKYIKYRAPDIPVQFQGKVGKDIHDIFDKFYDNIDEIPDEPYDYFVNSMKVLPQYQSIFNGFCLFESERYKTMEHKEFFKPILREKKITLSDGTNGIIDRVDFYNGEYSVLDYKPTVSNPSKVRFELNFYKMILDESGILDTPIKYIASYGYYSGEIFFEEISVRSYNSMLRKVEAFRNLDFNNIEYPKKESEVCNTWCPYQISCKKGLF